MTNEYTIEHTLRVAKRYNNPKRSYLLVNPLQGKHIPVSPTAALTMMHTLGERLVRQYPNTKLVIGFAETATAIGAAVASCFGEDCLYVHTTREPLDDDSEVIEFLEEHSHAAEQTLYGRQFARWLDATETVLLVEDEISTGKTMVNMVKQLKAQYPALREKKLVAASVLNRVSEENLQLMRENGIDCEYLVKLPEIDYTAAVAQFDVREAELANYDGAAAWETLYSDALPDPRYGVETGEYASGVRHFAERICSRFDAVLQSAESVLVLGTEEWMYPALRVGYAMEQCCPHLTVRSHATTRSPIGITDAEGYPITCGRKLMSLYDPHRRTYLYNLARYDAVFIVTDAVDGDEEGLHCLVSALREFGNERIYVIQGEQDVWYL